jgi:Uncharacterized conserved protein
VPQSVQIFAGPSITREEALSLLPGADFRPPVKRGDVASAVSDGAKVLVIIDGVFFQNEAVAHREILSALRAGVKVFGASSMGALRAAELDTLGMTGVGKIYEWYRSGKVIADDEVGMVFDAESGMALSDPMVNIRASFEKAAASGVISAEEDAALLKTCKGIYYPERTYRKVIKESPLADEKKTALQNWLKENKVDQKHLDAVECLKLVRDTLE